MDRLINAEVLGVLMALGDKYINKIPSQVMEYITHNCDMNSIPAIDVNKRIEDQNISKEARSFLTVLKLKYWCKSEDDKNALLKLLDENEKKKITE